LVVVVVVVVLVAASCSRYLAVCLPWHPITGVYSLLRAVLFGAPEALSQFSLMNEGHVLYARAWILFKMLKLL
jgi:hypothetical protein